MNIKLLKCPHPFFFWITAFVFLVVGAALFASKLLVTTPAKELKLIHPVETSANQTQTASISGSLYVNPDNRRYFTDGTMLHGKYKVVYLTGSHTWCDFMDCGGTNPPATFDYTSFLDFLQTNHHNFFRLWRAENIMGGEAGDSFWFNPMPYLRPGPGMALDGEPKFDLSKFNQIYFDRMRSHIIEARDRGVYVSIMLFDGWSIESKLSTHHPWIGHPFNQANNINGINGDPNGNGNGEEIQTLNSPESSTQQVILPLEEAYVRQVIDTVNDLDNVLYEICNESASGPAQTAWQYYMINYVKNYELTKPKQHPVGMSVAWPSGNNSDLFASPADWISPNGDFNSPSMVDGTKVVLYDTDHLGYPRDIQWVWKSFTRGGNPVFMDPYDKVAVGRGAPPDYDPKKTSDVSIRMSMGYALRYANRMNLVDMTPRPDLCSTDYCLANSAAEGAEYLVFLPTGDIVGNTLRRLKIEWNISMNLPSDSDVRVDLRGSPVELTVEWFNPLDGTAIDGGKVRGGKIQSFTSPFSGDAVLYIYDAHKP